MKLKRYKNFYSGTSNIVLPVPNKSFFPAAYQDKSRLCYYASLFNTVEINSSFYKIPMARTVEKWAADVPSHFRFTFKLWGGITHAKGLNYDVADVARFMNAIDTAGEKKGCLLIQFPASITISYFQKLKTLLTEIENAQPGHHGWRIAVEFRHRSWYSDLVYELLEQHNAAVVIHDMPASATPVADMEAAFVYLRFHGENGTYRGSYEDGILQEHAANIKDWLKDKKTVFVYFNNTMGEAVRNLITLNGY